MAKIVSLNDFTTKYFDLAITRREEGDYVGALNILNWQLKDAKVKYPIYLQIAKVYMELDMVRMAMRYWFLFLNTCPVDLRAEAYNGLGACFYLLDNYHLAGYYYELQLNCDPEGDYDYQDIKFEYFEMITEKDEPEFYIVHPLEKMPSDRRIEMAEKSMFTDGGKKAIKILETIDKDDENYIGAQLRIAADHIINSKPKKAKQVINRLIEDFPNDSLPLINKFVLLCEVGEVNEALCVYDQLQKFDLNTFQECYKVAVSCTDIGAYNLAEEYAARALDDDPTSVSGLFLMGSVKYNLKKYEEAQEYFKTLYQLTNLNVAKYYYDMALSPNDKKSLDIIGSEMHYPDKVVRGMLTKIIKYQKKLPKINSKNLATILNLCDWLFAFKNNIQQEFTVTLLETNNKKIINYFLDLLLVNEIDDELKFIIIKQLILLGNSSRIGVVFSGIYTKIKLVPIEELDKGNVVKSAYSLAFAQISGFFKSDLRYLKQSAILINKCLQKNNNILKIEDEKALAVVVVLLADDSYFKEINLLAGYFNTTKASINKTLKLVREENEDR